jgi:hypothetical protein
MKFMRTWVLPILFAASGITPADLAMAAADAVYYVGSGGSEQNPGTLQAPFATIGRCASELRAQGGGTCVVKEGIYREAVAVPSNSKFRAFTAAGRRDAVVISVFNEYQGTDYHWDALGNNVSSTEINLMDGSTRLVRDDPQILIDKKPTIEARWPNILDFSHLLDAQAAGLATAGRGSEMTTATVNGTSRSVGTIRDENLPRGLNLTGAVAHVRGNLNWGAHTGVIYESGAGFIRYLADNFQDAPLIDQLKLTSGSKYYIDNILPLLDSPTESFYDRTTQKLYFYSAPGDSPEHHTFQIKMREHAFLLDGVHDSTIEGFTIEGAISTDNSSENNTINSVTAKYLSHFVRSKYGPFSGYGDVTGIRIWGKRNILKNSILAYSAGNGVSLRGTGHVIENNRIDFIDYSGTYSAPLYFSLGPWLSGIMILQNTITRTGRDAIN